MACVNFGQSTPLKREIWTFQSHSSSEWLGKEWIDGLLWCMNDCLWHNLVYWLFLFLPHKSDTTCNVKWIHNKWDTVKISMCDGFIPCCLHSLTEFFFSSFLHILRMWRMETFVEWLATSPKKPILLCKVVNKWLRSYGFAVIEEKKH